MPTLTPVDFDPFYEATGADKPEQPKPQAKLLANTLFGAIPFLGPVLGHESVRNSFMEGFNKSGGAGLKSMGEALENQYVPEGAVKFDDAGQYYDKDGKPLFTQRRPNLVPLTKDEKGGVELAMPAMADVWNTLGGPGGATLGAGPSLRPALKYMDKIYKAKQGEQHLDAIPADLRATFEKQAMSGEDISNFNFGFINHKGHFLQREDALKYAIDHGILDPQDAKYGTLVTTMLNKSGGEGKIASTFFSALEDNLNKINQNKASGDQWLSTLQNSKGVKGEEIEWTGLKDFLAGKKNVTKQEIQDYLKENSVNINDVWKGGASTYPYRTADEWQNAITRAEANNDWERVDRLNRAWEQFEGYGSQGATKYEKWQLPGGENYRELLMTLPNKKYDELTTNLAKAEKDYTEAMNTYQSHPATMGDNPHYPKVVETRKVLRELEREKAALNSTPYKSSHWDEPNILAHMRMNDRTIDGKKSLHLEEIQSDWHQQGREKGYKNKNFKEDYDKYTQDLRERAKAHWYTEAEKLNLPKEKADQIRAKTLPDDLPIHQVAKYMNEEAKLNEMWNIRQSNIDKIPDAPFKKTWHELALKRAIREAAENGYERLSWTPGEAQAARYDLSKQLKELQYLKHDDGTYEIAGITSKGDGFNHPDRVTASKLPDIVGKEMAEKIIKNEGKRNRGQPSNGGYFEGVDLKIGGEGMKGFYDQIIPKSVEKIAKEFGVKVQKGEVSKSNNTNYRIENDTGKINDATDKYPHAIYYDNPEGKKKMLSAYATEKEAKEALAKLEKDKQPIFYIDIPPAMRQAVMQKGQPLFSGTSLVPVSHIPEFEDEK